jgi:hypothetical protein
MTMARAGRRPIFSLSKYSRGVAAFIANRTAMPYPRCRDIVAWHWPIVVAAYDEGARFQVAGQKILATERRGPVST